MAKRMPPKGSTPRYEWSEMGEARYGAKTTPDRLAAELKPFVGPEGFKPHDIVEAAKDPKSFLHPFFEWSDKKAGHAYRLSQARMLTASLRAKVVDPVDPKEMQLARAFHSISVHGRRSYYDVEQIRNSASLQTRLLEMADRDLQHVRDRHRSIRLVCDVIDEARAKIAEAKAKYTGERPAAH